MRHKNKKEQSKHISKYPYMGLSGILDFEKDMQDQNVSVISRSRGFLKRYKEVKGRPHEMGYMKTPYMRKWTQHREAFLDRTLAKIKKNNELLYKDDGQPTRRTLSLYAWAFDPSPQTTRKARIKKKKRR
jgi:hypothetical protein